MTDKSLRGKPLLLAYLKHYQAECVKPGSDCYTRGLCTAMYPFLAPMTKEHPDESQEGYYEYVSMCREMEAMLNQAFITYTEGRRQKVPAGAAMYPFGGMVQFVKDTNSGMGNNLLRMEWLTAKIKELENAV